MPKHRESRSGANLFTPYPPFANALSGLFLFGRGTAAKKSGLIVDNYEINKESYENRVGLWEDLDKLRSTEFFTGSAYMGYLYANEITPIPDPPRQPAPRLSFNFEFLTNPMSYTDPLRLEKLSPSKLYNPSHIKIERLTGKEGDAHWAAQQYKRYINKGKLELAAQLKEEAAKLGINLDTVTPPQENKALVKKILFDSYTTPATLKPPGRVFSKSLITPASTTPGFERVALGGSSVYQKEKHKEGESQAEMAERIRQREQALRRQKQLERELQDAGKIEEF